MGSAHVEVRQNSVWALGQILQMARSPTQAIIGADGTAVKRSRLRYTTASMMGPFAESIAKLLDDTNAEARFYAVEALGLMGPVAAAFSDKIVPSLTEDDPEWRQNAAWALGQLGVSSDIGIEGLVG